MSMTTPYIDQYLDRKYPQIRKEIETYRQQYRGAVPSVLAEAVVLSGDPDFCRQVGLPMGDRTRHEMDLVERIVWDMTLKQSSRTQ